MKVIRPKRQQENRPFNVLGLIHAYDERWDTTKCGVKIKYREEWEVVKMDVEAWRRDLWRCRKNGCWRTREARG